MARTSGSLGVSFNFEPQIAGPFDARAIVPTKADLTGSGNWTALDGGNYVYNGMTVTVAEDSTTSNNGIYVLTDATNVTDINNWLFVGSGGGGSVPTLDQVTDAGNTTTNPITVSVVNAITGDFSGQVTASMIGVNADNFNGAFEVNGISYQAGRVLFPELKAINTGLKFLAIQTGSLGGFGELTALDFSHFVSSSNTGSFLYSGSYDSSTSTVTLYSNDTNYTLDLSGLAGGGGGGFAITASNSGSVLTENARSFDFVGNAVTATNVGSAVTVTVNTGSHNNIGTADQNLTGDRTVTANGSNLLFDMTTANFQITTDSAHRIIIEGLNTGDNPQVLGIDASGIVKAMNTSSIAGGGSTSPGGTDTQVQYNNGGSFGGSSIRFDDVNSTVGINVAPYSNRAFAVSSSAGIAMRLQSEQATANRIQFFNANSVGAGVIAGTVNGDDFHLQQTDTTLQENLYVSASGEVHMPRIAASTTGQGLYFDSTSGEVSYGDATVSTQFLSNWGSIEITTSDVTRTISGSAYAVLSGSNTTAGVGLFLASPSGVYAGDGLVSALNLYYEHRGYATDIILFDSTVNYQGRPGPGERVIATLTESGYYGFSLITSGQDGLLEAGFIGSGSALLGGGSSAPGGSNTQIQFNENGSLGGDANFTWNSGSNYLTIKGNANAPALKLENSTPGLSDGSEIAELVARSSAYSADIAGIIFKGDGASGGGDYPSRIEFTTTPDGSTVPTTKFQIKNDGKLVANQYGSGTFTGTAAKWLAVDSSGNVIEEDNPTATSSNILTSGSYSVNATSTTIYGLADDAMSLAITKTDDSDSTLTLQGGTGTLGVNKSGIIVVKANISCSGLGGVQLRYLAPGGAATNISGVAQSSGNWILVFAYYGSTRLHLISSQSF